MIAADRLKGPLRGIARRADPFALYRCLYGARVRAQSTDLRLVDVETDDPLLPRTMGNVPLYLGIPGARVRLRLRDESGAIIVDEHGARKEISVMIGWENGSPERPFAFLGDGSRGGSRELVSSDLVESIVFPVHGRVEIGGAGAVPLLPTDGVLTGLAIDVFSGLPHFALGNASQVVFAKKIPTP
jgi:hypothetical protein